MVVEGADVSPIWYFAYGSNMRSAVMKNRGVPVLAAKRAVIPAYGLTFDVFGVPYSEPAMASIAPRDGLGSPAEKTSLAVHGVAYLLGLADYRKLIVSEGAGVAYTEAVVEAEALEGASVGGHRPIFVVHTLVARYPFRPNALPSARYLGLLIDGAEEHDLPESYREYLGRLPCYKKNVSNFEEFGASLLLGFWMPVLSWMMRRIKATASQSGRTQHGMGPLVWFMFNLMWWYHDVVHCRIWGRGGGRP